MVAAEKSSWWHGFGQLIRGRVLAVSAVAVVMIFAAGYFQKTHREPFTTAVDATPVAKPEPVTAEPFAAAALSLDQEEQSLGPVQTGSAGVSNASAVGTALSR